MYGALLIVQPPDGNTITSNYNRAVFLSGPGMSGDLVILHFSTLLTVGWPSKCVLWPPMASETRRIYLVRQWNQKAIGHQALLCKVAMVTRRSAGLLCKGWKNWHFGHFSTFGCQTGHLHIICKQVFTYRDNKLLLHILDYIFKEFRSAQHDTTGVMSCLL